MSENKEYVSGSDELGNIHISEEVLAGTPPPLWRWRWGSAAWQPTWQRHRRELLAEKIWPRASRVQMEDEKVTVDLSILMAYGHHFPRWAAPCRTA